MSHRHLCFCALLILSWLGVTSAHANDLTIKARNADIDVQVRPARGNLIFIWQANEVGIQQVDQQLMQQLADHGVETWLLDLLESYFLPNTPNNMERVPNTAFADVIQAAAKTGKQVIVGTSGRGVIPVLRGIRQWQLEHPANRQLRGTILLSPKCFVETPEPGLRGKLMPIVRATNQTIVLMQPDKSPWYWKLNQTLSGLRQGGSDVYLWPLHGIRDRFYFRADASKHEQQAGTHLAARLHTAIQLLLQQPAQTRQAVKTIAAAPKAREGKKAHSLSAYKGNPVPPPLRLQTVHGKTLDLADFKGRVVLVNFWATWCPPCVHEMPSMQQLADHFKGKAFTILGVNMAEDASAVTQFIRKRVHVSFPIVLDKDGKALKAWHVFAFPTTYIIDKHGRIRYALFGGIDWNTPAIRHKLAALINE
ncbi:MAG: TlpA disulfide reductase family protein [Gammaproteobacteria bacterium]